MVDVNIVPALLLTKKFLNKIRDSSDKNRRYCVLTTSSLAGFAPQSANAAYAATKNFMTHWKRALAFEMKQLEGKGPKVDIQALCPSFITTAMTTQLKKDLFYYTATLTAEQAASGALTKLGNG